MFFKNIYQRLNIKNLVKMNSVFVQKLNPMTGVNDWVVLDDDYDYHQEVANSGFTDMLHDTERNQLYEKAIKIAIDKIHDRGEKAKVLDIGTGTGLLAMMAARHGAESVIACEVFLPMSKCAVSTIKLNGFSDRITVIPKRSTELTVGEHGDLKEKCNILVTEVFDTELIGEGAILTFSHAHKYLLEDNCIVVPHSATIFAQVVECPLAQNWNNLKDVFDNDGDILLKIPDSIKKCAGSAAVHDIQLSQLPADSFNIVSEPLHLAAFDWSGKSDIPVKRTCLTSFKSKLSGSAHMVFMWWELQMDQQATLILSCAPIWSHAAAETPPIPWRDHWLQAIYYFPHPKQVKKREVVDLVSAHDEYSMWFDLLIDDSNENPVCTCGLHTNFSRTRIGQMNDVRRIKKYLKVLEKHVKEDSCVIFLGDCFFLGLIAAKLGASKVYFIENNSISRRIINDFIKFNNLMDKVEVFDDLKALQSASKLESVDLIFAEPYFSISILPWDNLYFLYLLRGIRPFLRNKNVKILPQKVSIHAVAVRFDDLHKIRSPLVECEGFSMKHFDELIKVSTEIGHDAVEAQPLWEYPAVALSQATEIASIELSNESVENIDTNGTFKLDKNLPVNGIALWVDWYHDTTVISTGPVAPIEIGKKIQWDMYTRQAVCLFANKNINSINYRFKFNVSEGVVNFSYDL